MPSHAQVAHPSDAFQCILVWAIPHEEGPRVSATPHQGEEAHRQAAARHRARAQARGVQEARGAHEAQPPHRDLELGGRRRRRRPDRDDRRADPQAANYSAGGTGAEVEGVETFENTSDHVQGAVDYPQTPPAGGQHNPAWLNCGVYDEPVPNENAVHSLEHGAVWVTYDPRRSPTTRSSTLESTLPSTYVILSPFDGLPSPIVLSGWNSQLQVDEADDPRIAEFLEEYWKSQDVPEPGASCTGADRRARQGS